MGGLGEIGGISASPPDPSPLQLGPDGPLKLPAHQAETAPRILEAAAAPTDPPRESCLVGRAG